MIYLKEFANHNEYTAYTADTRHFLTPNTSLCQLEDDCHFTPMGPAYDYSKDYFTFYALEDGTFKFTRNTIYYSLDSGNTWVSLSANTNSPTVNAGNRIMWKMSGKTPSSSYGIGTFSSTGQFEVEGNIMSLVSGDSFVNATTINNNHQFYDLFRQCNNVISAKNLILPATTLANYCYGGMFSNCTSLTTAPQICATTMAASACTSMFYYCTSLTTAPELPATTMATFCYYHMFNGCSSLTKAPSILPATTLVSQCYVYMFLDCTSLTTAPELPATTLVQGCYDSMFKGCSNLNYIKAMFTTTPSYSYTSKWVNGVAASGTFVKNSAAQWDVTGVDGVPDGWTIETESNEPSR